MNRLLAVFAHPDDETFRPGGTLALLARQGVQVQVLTLTHGEAGWPSKAAHSGQPTLRSPDELAFVREQELRCACTALGLQPPHILDYPDGKLFEVDPVRVTGDILAFVRQVGPQVLISFGPDGLSGHPDHILTGKWAADVFDCFDDAAVRYTLGVPQSLAAQLGMTQVHPVPDAAIALTIDVSSVWEAKLAAIHCHATQWSSSPMLSAPAERQRLFFGQEHFVRAAVHSSAGDFLPQVLKGFLL